MTGRAKWLALALVLAAGCAMPPDETAGAQPDSEAQKEEPAEPVAPEPGAASPAPVGPQRSLAELERELTNNEAKLQALGVELRARTTTADDAVIGGEKPAQERKAEAGGGSGAAKSATRPSPAPSREDEPSGKAKGDRKGSKPKKTDSAAVPGGVAPAPDPAKATPLSPTEQPQLDAATRCSQVCSLSDITCELGVQICELAQRHVDNEDYEQACVRATEDCDAAQEACDACTQ